MAAAEKSITPLWSSELSQPESSSSVLSSSCSRSADAGLRILSASGKTEQRSTNSEFRSMILLGHHHRPLRLCGRITFSLEPLEQVLSLPSQRAEVGLTAHVVVHGRADRQVIQQQPERRVLRRVPQVLSVVIQPCLNKGHQRAVEAAEKSLQVNCWGQKWTRGRFKHNWTLNKGLR